ncbi:MAG: hypothetical protein GTO16_13830 [Candidatus Aminicenantes bacterium]|nr:hypothetical protein [Candidatus Aminicenantes bacterium]
MADYSIVTLTEFKRYAGITSDDDNKLLEELIARASDFIEYYLARKLKSRIYTHERYDGDGKDYLFVENYPITAVERLSIGTLDAIRVYYGVDVFNAYARVSTTGVTLVVDGTAGSELTFSSYATLATMATAINGQTSWTGSVAISDYNSWPSALLYPQQNIYAVESYGYLKVPDEPIYDYRLDANRGMIYYSTGFDSGVQNIFLTYTAGYTASTMPGAIKQACFDLVKFKYEDRQGDPNMKSEKKGDYSYTRMDLEDALPKSLKLELAMFRRPLV